MDSPNLGQRIGKTELRVLRALDAPRTRQDAGGWKRVSTLVEESGLPRATVYRHLDTLGNRALVTKNHGRYRLGDGFADLRAPLVAAAETPVEGVRDAAESIPIPPTWRDRIRADDRG